MSGSPDWRRQVDMSSARKPGSPEEKEEESYPESSSSLATETSSGSDFSPGSASLPRPLSWSAIRSDAGKER